MKKGDIVLVSFPFTDLSSHKKRPALVLVSSDQDVVVAFITTKIFREDKFDVLLNPNSTNGLKKKSLIRLDKITTLDKNLIIGKLGEITASKI